jgi:hypothetical protein
LHQRGIYFCNEWGLSQNILPGEPRYLPFRQLFDPIRLLTLSISDGNDEVRYPGVIIDDISFRLIACREGYRVLIGVQSSLKVRYFVCKDEGGQHILLLPPADGGSKALGNVEDGDRVILVELHHSFSGGGGDGLRRGRGGPYGGQRAKGCFDQSIDGDGRHFLGSVGVVIGTGVVFTEPSVDESVVGGLVIDPQEEELSGLEVGLELEGNNFKGNSADRQWF